MKLLLTRLTGKGVLEVTSNPKSGGIFWAFQCKIWWLLNLSEVNRCASTINRSTNCLEQSDRPRRRDRSTNCLDRREMLKRTDRSTNCLERSKRLRRRDWSTNCLERSEKLKRRDISTNYLERSEMLRSRDRSINFSSEARSFEEETGWQSLDWSRFQSFSFPSSYLALFLSRSLRLMQLVERSLLLNLSVCSRKIGRPISSP